MGKLHQLRGAKVSQLPVLFGAWLGVDGGPAGSFYDRIFTPVRIFWLFLAQVLSADGSCREAVELALAWMAVEQGELMSGNTSAYCQARKRLPADWLARLCTRTREHLVEQAGSRWLWQGRRVRVVDGTCVSLADTRANRKSYPQPSSQKRGCGFPLMRLACSFCLSTGALLEWVEGTFGDNERTLWHRLWSSFGRGEVVLTDRGFCSFADIWALSQQGVDCVMRANARRTVGVREVRRLGKGDRLIEWVRTAIRPAWIDDAQWQSMPSVLMLREITYEVVTRGFRTKSVTVVTTLLNAEQFAPSDFAELYRRRWMIELFLRDIKITLGMDQLRCKSPAMARKELQMYVIAYNLIRGLMLEAANQYPIQPTQLSFKAAVSFTRQWSPILASLSSRAKQKDLEKALLYYIAHQVVGNRPNRTEPRAVKRRPKQYQRLNKPRHQFKELPHKSRYRKPKS